MTTEEDVRMHVQIVQALVARDGAATLALLTEIVRAGRLEIPEHALQLLIDTAREMRAPVLPKCG